jgi:hypothetical protein
MKIQKVIKGIGVGIGINTEKEMMNIVNNDDDNVSFNNNEHNVLCKGSKKPI